MKRLGIFSFYDKEGIVDSYIEYLLSDLKENLDKLIITVNGIVNHDGLKILENYADQVLIRENKGFDAGAYKDVFVNILGEDEIKKWDEIVLCNDTFYGPFISFKTIFNIMEQKKNDFWGLNYVDRGFLSHIQAYFLVFKKNIIKSGDLFVYVSNYVDSETTELFDIYASFEVGIFSYLKRRGYIYDSFAYTNNCDIYADAYICVKKYNLPILKKKSFSVQSFSESIINLLNYIQMNLGYDINHIISSANRLYKNQLNVNSILDGKRNDCVSLGTRVPDVFVSEDEILEFIQTHTNIYIYGTGRIARKMWFCFHMDIEKFGGFIVSDDQIIEKDKLYGYPVKHYKDVEEGVSILLCLGLENSKSVIQDLKEKDDILFLWDKSFI